MSSGNNDPVNEDSWMSEDSESTQGSDLDYELKIDVLLPDNTIQKTSVPAYTPWGDLRTQLCSRFKLSPSTHMVDFVSSSVSVVSNHKRRSSRAVGRMDITMVTIKEKRAQVKHAAPPPPVPTVNSAEGSVRLIVRLPRSRQSILRVNPGAPLSTIFNNISDKLKLNDEGKSSVEFRHPSQHDVKLNDQLTLNDYNLREVFLANKADLSKPHSTNSSAPSTPSRSKRKAPPPPRPPLPSLSARNKSTSEDTSVSKKAEERPAEPVYAQVQKPKPMKRRAAPAAPAPAPTSVATSQSSTPAAEADTEKVGEKKKPEVRPRKTPREKKDSIETSAKESKPLDDDPLPQREDISHPDDIGAYASIEDIQIMKEKKSIEIPPEEPEVPVSEENEVFEDAMKAIDEVLELDDSDEGISDGDVEQEETAVTSIDDVVRQLDDVTIDDVKVAEKNAIGEEKEESKMNGSAEASDQDEQEDVDPSSVEPKFPSPPSSNAEVDHSPPQDIAPLNDYPSHDDHLSSDAPPASVKASYIEEQRTSIDTEPVDDEDHTSSSPPPQVPVDDVTSSIPPSQAPVNDVTASSPPSQSPVHDVTSTEDEDPFDLHIAESFHIPLRSIDDERELPEVKRKEPEVKKKEVVSTPTVALEKADDAVPEKEEKVKTEAEGDETEKEIEKLHKQIRRMKNQNAKKQKEELASRNGWQPGSHSFTFVPSKSRQFAHRDYEIAPVQAIELSSSGEIKSLNENHQKKPEPPVLHTEAHRAKTTLPSYYKKLLGAQAFNQAK